MKKNFFTTKNIAGTAILSAIAGILYVLSSLIPIKLPIFPSFLDLQISEIPCLIAGYCYGPVFGIISVVIRCIIKIISGLSGTLYVGELADLIIGIALVLPASLIYKKDRTLKGALFSLVISAFISTAVALLANQYVLIPFYLELFFKGDISKLLAMCSSIKGITEQNFMTYYLLFGVLPFNLLRYLIVGIFTFLLYKKTEKLLDRIK